jgi:hypothetical protein
MQFCALFFLLYAFTLTTPGAQLDATNSFGLAVKNGGLTLNGTPYRGVGANYFDLFLRLLRDPQNTSSLTNLEELHRAGIPFVRFAMVFGKKDYQFYRDQPEEYFHRLDRVVATAGKCGIGLIPSFCWTMDLPEAVGETHGRWADPQSKTIATMRRLVGDTVRRYRTSPVLWAWEFGNEMNFAVDIPSDKELPREIPGACLTNAISQFAREVRRWDSTRAIFSGNSHPRPSAWHNSHENSWTADDAKQSREMLLRDNPAELGTIAVHYYCRATAPRQAQVAAWTDDRKKWFHWLKGVAQDARAPLWVGEFGVDQFTNSPAEIEVEFSGILRDMEVNQVDLAAFWVFDLSSQEADWSVTFTNRRTNLLKLAVQANRRWSQTATNLVR